MAIFGDFFASCFFSASSMPDINLQRLRLGKEKKEERTNHSMKIYMVCPIP